MEVPQWRDFTPFDSIHSSSLSHVCFSYALRKRCIFSGEEAEIAKVEEPGGGTRYELRGVPESGKARLEALFQVGSFVDKFQLPNYNVLQRGMHFSAH